MRHGRTAAATATRSPNPRATPLPPQPPPGEPEPGEPIPMPPEPTRPTPGQPGPEEPKPRPSPDPIDRADQPLAA